MSRIVCKHNVKIEDECSECEKEAEEGLKKMGFKEMTNELENKMNDDTLEEKNG